MTGKDKAKKDIITVRMPRKRVGEFSCTAVPGILNFGTL